MGDHDHLPLNSTVFFNIAAIVSSWANPSAQSKHWNAVDSLTRLQVLCTGGKAVEPAYHLSKSFSQHVRVSLCSGIKSLLNAVGEDVLAAVPAKEEVDEYAANQWEVRNL